ncbi:MAG: hypothetical protein AAF296_13665 [Pseudomonadota bacterium]
MTPISFNPYTWPDMPIWLWPIVWWQLLKLQAEMRADPQPFLYQIEPNGQVIVYFLPDETDLNAWLYQQSQIYRDHWVPMHDPSGEAHLSAIRYWTPRYMARGHLINFISQRTGFDPAPAIEDSS